MNRQPRQTLPSAVKRQLRQESGFGCCECGHPFIEYHHIIPYAEEAHFRPEDMMVLCPNHHALCTTGAMTEKEQRAMKARPRNIAEGELRGQLFVTTDKLRVQLGSALAINTPDLIHMGGRTLLRARSNDEGQVLISAVIQSPDGTVAALLEDNEWTVSPEAVWDFEAYHRRAVVRSGPRQIVFEVDCREENIRMRGKWHYGRVPIEFNEQETIIGGNRIQALHAEDSGCLIMVA